MMSHRGSHYGRPVRAGKRPPSRPFRSLPNSTSDTPNGIRTRAAGVKGRSPRPLDDGGVPDGGYRGRVADMRVATLEDVDGVYELLDVRSRAAFGVSEVVRSNVEADFRRVAADRWVADEGGAIVGY